MKFKKLFILGTSCFFMAACDKPQKTETTTQPNSDTSVVKTQKHNLSAEDVKLMVNLYKKERQEIINNDENLKRKYGDDFLDTRSIWFSIDELKQFIREAEAETKKSKSTIKLEGLRLYFTVYPEVKEGESEYFKSVPKKYRNHHSLVFVPTYYNVTKKIKIDYDLFEQSDSLKLKSLRAFVPSTPAPPTYNSLYLNFGALCPPNCPPTPTASVNEGFD